MLARLRFLFSVLQLLSPRLLLCAVGLCLFASYPFSHSIYALDPLGTVVRLTSSQLTTLVERRSLPHAILAITARFRRVPKATKRDLPLSPLNRGGRLVPCIPPSDRLSAPSRRRSGAERNPDDEHNQAKPPPSPAQTYLGLSPQRVNLFLLACDDSSSFRLFFLEPQDFLWVKKCAQQGHP